jgi:hypothetical protein
MLSNTLEEVDSCETDVVVSAGPLEFSEAEHPPIKKTKVIARVGKS